MDNKEIAKSEYEDFNRTAEGKFTGRFKQPATGEDFDEKEKEDDGIPEKKAIVQTIKGDKDQLTPLEKLEEEYHKSQIGVNNRKELLFKAIRNFVIPVMIGIVVIAISIWLFQISEISGPIRQNTTDITNLKSKNSELDSRMNTLEERIYNFLNTNNNSSKQ